MTKPRQYGLRFTSTTVKLDPEQRESLRTTAAKLRVPATELIRQGIDLLLERQVLGARQLWLPGVRP